MPTLKMLNVPVLFACLLVLQPSFTQANKDCYSGSQSYGLNPGFIHAKEDSDATLDDIDRIRERFPLPMRRVFEYSCSRHWTFLFPNSTTNYLWPDQATTVEPAHNVHQVSSIVYQNLDSFKQSIVDQIKVIESPTAAQALNSVRYLEAKEVFRKSKYFIAKYTESFSLLRVMIAIKFKDISEEFRVQLKNLPDNFDPKNPKPYLEFVDKFGTHFNTEFVLGGKLQTQVKILREYVWKTAKAELDNNMERYFHWKISNQTQHKPSEKFLANIEDFYPEHTAAVLGGTFEGQQSLYYIDSVPNWLKTLMDSSVIVAKTVRPIYKLVEDKAKAEGLKKVIDAKMKRRK